MSFWELILFFSVIVHKKLNPSKFLTRPIVLIVMTKGWKKSKTNHFRSQTNFIPTAISSNGKTVLKVLSVYTRYNVLKKKNLFIQLIHTKGF